MTKIIIITGLTASGKSSIALDVARKYNGEIISADSVQIYRNLDIGSAKESKENMSEIYHHLIDIRDFDSSYNVGEFIDDCKIAINKILNKGKLPIIVGGTGLYIKALIEGFTLGNTSANQEYRTNLQSLAKEKGNDYIWQILDNKDSKLAGSVHKNNLKRVIRYLEILNFGEVETERQPSILAEYDVLLIGVVEDREIIYERINKRVDKMISLGLESEIKTIIAKGGKKEHQALTSIGYKEWFDYFDNKTSFENTIDLIKQHTRNYAKRQLTFLKTIKDIILLKPNQAKIKIEEFLNDNNK